MKFLFHKKSTYIGQLKLIFFDMLFVYKNFLHFCISKIIISFVSIVVGILFFLPIFLLTLVVMLLDPIPWYQILTFISSGSDVTLELVGELAMHPYWLILVGFLLLSSFVAFLLASSYNVFLLARLGLGYTKRKPVAYKKSFSFSLKYIFKHIGIIALTFVYLLGPVMIAVGCIFFLYLFLGANYIGERVFELLSILLAIIFIFSILYIIFRIIFGYICFADCKKKKNFNTARGYIFDSIQLTAGKTILKFIPVLLIYIIFVAPFNIFENSLSKNLTQAKDAYTYKVLDVKQVDDNDAAYFEYIMQEYSGLDSNQLSDRIQILSLLSIFYGIIYYFVIAGTFVMLMTSFYLHILRNK